MKAKSKGNILIADDTPESLRLLTEILNNEGYKVRSAINGELALSAAIKEAPELVLLDVSMPDMDGYEVCTQFKKNNKLSKIPIIFVSAYSQIPEKVKGFELGGVDYIAKPYQKDELLARVNTHLELSRLQYRLEEMVEVRTQSLFQSEGKLKKSLVAAVSAVAAVVEMRDPYTAGHQRRVAKIAVEIAREMNVPEKQIEGLYLASVVHDVGKINIPSEILTKPGKLSNAEYSLIKQHSDVGFNILKEIEFPWPIAEIVLQHHERLDGSGYPKGLKGNKILFEAKILSVSDVIEAVATARPYRPALGLEKAISVVSENKSVQFDPVVIDACVNIFEQGRLSLNDPE